jgi:SNF2 family DNA or RNA helicase
MSTLALAQLSSGISTTVNVLTQMMRLHQIVCGFIRFDDERFEDLPNHRMQELLNTVEETQGKVIIWATYRHNIEAIKLALQKAYGMGSVGTYYGDTKEDERQSTLLRFQDPEDSLRFFVGNPATGGYGITLTAATTVIYYSNSFDLEKRLQSEDRAHRIGQKNNVTYVDLIARDTIDERIVQALRDKIDIATKVLGEEAKKWLI